MRLGIGSYTYVWSVGVPGYPQPDHPWTEANLLDRATELGVRVVQIADNLPLHRLAEPELDALRRDADARGIALEVGTAGIDAANLVRYAAIARRLGSPILRTLIDHGPYRPSPEEVVARLKPLIPVFEAEGVILAIENHDRFKAVTLREIIQKLRSRSVGICLDTSNSLGCMEGPEHIVDVLGPLVVNLHIKDVRVFRPTHHKGFIVEGCAAGQGQLDIPALLRRLRELGSAPNAIVELWPPPEVDLAQAMAKEATWTRESVAYMRTLVRD